MTYEEAQAELNDLRGLAERGEALAPYRKRVETLYSAVCRKALRECNCKDVLSDAIFEIYAKLKQLKSDNKMDEVIKAKARLVAGVVLQIDGAHYTNANLTDDVAREFLSRFPMRADWFAVMPPEKEAEKGAETPAEEVKETKQPAATSKKKTAKKRKNTA